MHSGEICLEWGHCCAATCALYHVLWFFTIQTAITIIFRLYGCFIIIIWTIAEIWGFHTGVKGRKGFRYFCYVLQDWLTAGSNQEVWTLIDQVLSSQRLRICWSICPIVKGCVSLQDPRCWRICLIKTFSLIHFLSNSSINVTSFLKDAISFILLYDNNYSIYLQKSRKVYTL